MARPHYVGIGLGHLDASLAHWAPETPPDRLPTSLLERLPGASVVCRRAVGERLSFAFAAGRSFRAGELAWLEALLTHLRRTWLSNLAGEVRTVLSVPPDTRSSDRARCRELARRCGWEQARVVGAAAAVAVAVLGPASSPVTALVVQTDLESTDLSLVTVLQRHARVRGRLRLRCLSHAGTDEAILALIGGNVGARWPEDEAGCLEVWADADKVRKQLDTSPAGAAVLSGPAWGLPRAGTVSVARDDLWPLLQPDCQAVVDAAGELLTRHQVSPDELSKVLLAGGGVTVWDPARELFAARLNKAAVVLPPGIAAAGAALLAAESDAVLGEDVDLTESAWAQVWEARTPSSLATAVQVRVGVEWGPTRAVQPSRGAPAIEAEYLRALDTAWDCLRDMVREDASRARQFAEEARTRLEEFLDSLPAEEGEQAAPSSLLIQAAEVLRTGDLSRAVDLAHQARDVAPENPQVFRQMINLHVQAADVCASPQEAIAWLECAYRHDQANRLVHQHLAARYREYARVLADAGRADDSVRAARRSLDFEPFDVEGVQLAAGLKQATAPRPPE